MIKGIGIDSVEINRFTHWHTYSDMQLLRIFSIEEIAYCRSNQLKSAERFAVRYAAREALFKSLQQNITHQIPFLRVCKATTIKKDTHGRPSLVVDWQLIGCASLHDCVIWLSLTHTKNSATAMILLEKKISR